MLRPLYLPSRMRVAEGYQIKKAIKQKRNNYKKRARKLHAECMDKPSNNYPQIELKSIKNQSKNRCGKKEGFRRNPGPERMLAAGPGDTQIQQDRKQTNRRKTNNLVTCGGEVLIEKIQGEC